MKLLDEYLQLQKKLFKYFGYVEDYRVIPVDDKRKYYWRLIQHPDGHGCVQYADSIENLNDEEMGEYYEDEIYTQRFLSKWVYRGPKFTMICTDPHVDLNQFLSIFDNKKEVK